MKLKIAIDGRTYDVEVEDADPQVSLESPDISPIQSSVLPSATKLGVSSDFDESKVSRSPLAGVVARLEVAPGQNVEQNQILLILEAMKMEIKVTAQSAGSVKSIDVAPGDAVRPNQVLLWFI